MVGLLLGVAVRPDRLALALLVRSSGQTYGRMASRLDLTLAVQSLRSCAVEVRPASAIETSVVA